jgi:galactonate dehydratase
MPDNRRTFLTKVAAGALGSGVAVGTGVSAVSAWTGAQTNSVVNQARPADNDMLKIAKVEPFIMQTSRDAQGKLTGTPYLFCRLETTEGIVGWGEGTNFQKEATIATEIEMVKPWVIGQSAYDIERTWAMIFRARNAMHGSAVQSTISAIDMALWDIVGQKLNLPVYKLLGGKINDKIKIYTSYRWGNIPRTADAYKKRTQELVAEGAMAGKFDPFFDEPDFAGYSNATASRYDSDIWSRQAKLSTINNVAEMIQGIREGGPNFEICIEAHAKFNADSAPRIIKAVEPYNPFWLEEPVPPGNVEAMARVQRLSSVPIAAGERLKSRLEVREYIERDALRILQPDAARIGGITELRKVASLAETHWIPVAPHNPNGPICLAAHLHLATSMSNFMILEEGHDRQAEGDELFTGGWQNSRAYFMPRETPGLGLKFSDDYVRQHSLDINTAERSG